MAEGKKKQKKSPWWYKLGILVFGAVFCVSAFMAGRDYLAAKKEADAFDSLSKLAADYAEEKAPADLTESAGETTDQEKAAEWAELLKEAAGYAALKNENPDYVGWIRLPDTRIDYPVVDRESDPEYYLHRAFDGSKSFGGTPFLGEASGVDTKCLIIYGHNMKNLSMFGSLKKYKTEDFYKDHQFFTIYTSECAYRYQIFAYYDVPETDEVYTVGFAPDETFQKFIDKMKQKPYDDTGVNVTKDDHIMTLSTCSTTGKRFVVHAVRIGEHALEK